MSLNVCVKNSSCSITFLPYQATLDQYQEQAEALFEELTSGSESYEWRIKCEHLLFVGKQ